MNVETLIDAIDRDGFCVCDGLSSGPDLEHIRDGLAKALQQRRETMVRNGITQRTEGTGHHLLERESVLMAWLQEFAESPQCSLVERLLGGKAILNAFGAVDNRRGNAAYVASVHRDIRTFTRDHPLMVQLLFPLDDFLPSTGSTWLFPGSHRREARPDNDVFFSHALQITASAGQFVFFDSRLWHAAGSNQTDRPRRALTINFTRAFLKPQFDYCRYLGESYVANLPEASQQLLGYFARVPASPDEWYRTPERRFYRPNQG